MNIDELTLGQIKEIQSLLGNQQPASAVKSSAFTIGNNYFIRTATYHVTGELVAVYPNELILKKAAWIADSGRFSEALKTGNFAEVEMFKNSVIVNRFGIIDATIIDTLPTETK